MRAVTIALAVGLALTSTLASGPAARAQDFSTKAPFAVLMDHETGTVLFQKEAEERLEPASMAKLMTIAVVFDEISRGRLTMDEEFFISEKAWREGGTTSGGSTMFANVNSRIRVEDLVRSVIIQSGNDAAIALAEGIGGTEETFANIMNRKAEELGLDGSHFTNATGLPDPDQYSSARDLADLGRHIIRDYPDWYHYFSEPEMTWNNIRQPNRNSLVEMGIGVDGLKTGHTQAAGYGIVASTTQGGRRLIAVLHGLASERERAEEGRKLITWGTRGFELVTLYEGDEIVGWANVYGGAEGSVPLVGKDKIELFMPRGARDCPTGTISYDGPLRPPVDEGAQVATLNLFCNGDAVQQTPLFAGKTVEKGGIVRQASDALKQLALGWL